MLNQQSFIMLLLRILLLWHFDAALKYKLMYNAGTVEEAGIISFQYCDIAFRDELV